MSWEPYLLRLEVRALFAQVHPLVRAQSEVPYWLLHGWHIEGALGDMSGVRKSEVRRREESSTPSVRMLRERRRANGLCIVCGVVLDPASKNFCSVHREEDRLRAAEKRERRKAVQEKLPKERAGLTHHFEIYSKVGTNEKGEEQFAWVDGYLQANQYPVDDKREHLRGKIGEIFITVGKEGDASRLLDQWAISFSLALQYGAPFEELCMKFLGTKFEPAGATKSKDVPRCTSPVDYVVRWLLVKFGSAETRARFAGAEEVTLDPSR